MLLIRTGFNFLPSLKSKTLMPSTLNESPDIIIKISARDSAQDKNALALVSVKTQTRKYSVLRNEAGNTKQTEAPGREGTWLQSQSKSIFGKPQGLLSFVWFISSGKKKKCSSQEIPLTCCSV